MRSPFGLFALMLFAASVSAGDGTSVRPPTTLPARDAANFRPRANVEHLIPSKRSKDEDKLRAALLVCAQSDEELRMLTAMVNGRWNKKNIETLGGWLIEDWDKEYGPSLRRPKCIVDLLVYVRNHEKPYAFNDGEDVMVTIAEGKRLERLTENIDAAMAAYIEKLIDPRCKWPADSRSELLYNITAAFDENGAPEMITDAIWKAMADCKKFRWDMLGVMSNSANQATLERLLKFRNSQQWAEDDLNRIDQGVKDVKWWLERAAIMAKTKPPEPEETVIVSEEETKLMLKRVADAKAGRCQKIPAVGLPPSRASIDALSLLYTKINVSVAVLASDTGDVGGIGAMVSGSAEWMFLDGEPSDAAMKLHGDKWSALGSNGSGPAEYMIAGRAVAVIVNPANKLESLTPGQIQAIFQGEVGDWAAIGDTELTPVAGPDGKPGKLGINAFGLRTGGVDARSSAAASVFHKQCVAPDKFKRVTFKNNTAEAVAAVSMDPLAIAFVDLTAIPTTGQNVNVLPIKMGTSKNAKIVQPTPENVRNATYPLSQRLFLYVHPKASNTAKDFASFLATCGGSEASPYADTVKAVMETYQKHGLIPLADAAL